MDTDRTSIGVGAAPVGSSGHSGRPGPGRPRPDCRAADSWRRAADRRGSDPSGPVPDGLPVDPGHRRIVPAAGHHGFLVGTAVLVTGSRLAAAAGAVFALATLGGYLLSVWADLFGFT